MPLNLNNTVPVEFFDPLVSALDLISQTRNCPGYSDLDHLVSGISRAIELTQSGRDWIQQAQIQLNRAGGVGEFFDALRSPRRTEMVVAVAQQVAALVEARTLDSEDPLHAHKELEKFEVFASDGHTLAASAHEAMIEGKVRPHTHIFSLNLRWHSMRQLTLCTPKDGKKKEPEIKAMGRLSAQVLRMGTAKGRKVIHCYDPALVGYVYWKIWKTNGVYIITKEKSGSALKLVRVLKFDSEDARNNGVVSDEALISAEGIPLRRVVYVDPVSNKLYRFLTNEMTLPPGIIAFLYKLRWDIEKAFDESKNKFHEKKAWAMSDSSKIQQACFITIAHNLCLLLERRLQVEEGIVDIKSKLKRERRRDEEIEQAKERGNAFNAAVGSCHRITQRSQQFIRWLRFELRASTSWEAAIERLRPLMLKYLS